MQAAQGSQTGSHGSQLTAQHGVAESLAPKFAKSQPNGRNTGRPPHGSHAIGSHGSQATCSHGVQAIASHGWQAIGSHGWQATGSQGLQPFQTTERRPKMPASAVVAAAKTMIAVNVDNKTLCFIFILLKNYGWGNLLATIAIPLSLKVSEKRVPN